MIDILIPTMGRPHKLEALANNIAESTASDHRTVFIYEKEDHETFQAFSFMRIKEPFWTIENGREPCYAGAIQTAFNALDGDWIFAGADDIWFSPGWDTEAMNIADASGKRVIGTNDLHNREVVEARHATHYLFKRTYIEELGGTMDLGPKIVHYPYKHNFTDTEFIGVAKKRNEFAPALSSVVEHRHAVWGMAEWDAGYEKSITTTMDADKIVFSKRSKLWVN